jgi:hypothetical protein
MDAIDLFAGAGGFSTEAEATSIAISIDSAELHDENISAIPGAGMLSVGQWYWVLTDEDGQVEADDDDSEESEPGNLPDLIDHASVSALPKPPVEGAWLGCLVKIGSNHVEIRQPDVSHGYNYCRVHFDEIHSRLVLENLPDATLQGHIRHYHQKSQFLMGQIQALTLRLGLSSSPMISCGPGAESPLASQTNRALAVLNGQNNINAYQVALRKAKDEELPALFGALEVANQELTRWMKAQSLPLMAQSEGIKESLNDVDDRIFNVSIYAGLGETAVKVRDGKPAAIDERLRIMQRRLYMDEECLMNYRAGGMEFKDIAAYDKWLSKPENFNRILPFQRCIVAMRVRRDEKKRDWEGSLRQLMENVRVSASDKFTYMYIRNGEQLWRLDMEMEFDELIFPDKTMLNLSEPMMFKTFAGSRIDEMITVADFEQRLAKYNETQEQIRNWCESNPGKDSFHCPIREDRWFRQSDWHPFDNTSVYFDEAKGEIDQRIKYYNRIALIVQGLYDRSLVLHPHLPVRTWDANGFEDAIELIYDSSYSLTFGEPPDFEAYRAGVNALATADSLFVGQENFWMRLEAKRECDRLDRDYRSRKSEYRPTLFKPRGNPGPGLVEKAEKLQIRAQKATFKWERERKRQSEWGENAPVSCSLTVPFAELLNVSAYKAGDYKVFFRDPRTRTEYLKWAPLLLTAEDFLAGKLAD